MPCGYSIGTTTGQQPVSFSAALRLRFPAPAQYLRGSATPPLGPGGMFLCGPAALPARHVARARAPGSAKPPNSAADPGAGSPIAPTRRPRGRIVCPDRGLGALDLGALASIACAVVAYRAPAVWVCVAAANKIFLAGPV
jgi:hypothetical protein